MEFYEYWRSSAAYRIRIAFCLKNVEHQTVPIDILPGADEQFQPAFLALNPQARVPVIKTEKGTLAQSLAILDWLEETYPQPSFYCGDAWLRAQIRAFALTIACDVHPLNNLSVHQRLRSQFGAQNRDIAIWSVHWMETGFAALEAELAHRPKTQFAFGAAPTLADICLVPQFSNARRFRFDFSPYPRLSEIDENCRAHPAFIRAAPENHPASDGRP